MLCRCCCSTATVLRGCFEIQRECGLESSLVVFMAAHIRTHAHTEAPFVAVTRKTLQYGYYCCTMTATTSNVYGVIQAHSSSRQQNKNEKEKR